MILHIPIINNFNYALFFWAVVIHTIVDWLFQTEWMAINKISLRHPAAYVHSGLHAAALLLVFPWYLALLVGVTHLFIDTRQPVGWWIKHVKGMPKSAPTFSQVEMWLDQIFHGLILLFVVLALPILGIVPDL